MDQMASSFTVKSGPTLVILFNIIDLAGNAVSMIWLNKFRTLNFWQEDNRQSFLIQIEN